MILLIDMGNTRIKWIQYSQSLDNENALFHQHADFQKQLNDAWCRLPVPTAVYLASVGPATQLTYVTTWVKQHWNVDVHVIHASACAQGVTNHYDQPPQLGVDRWLAVIAAYQRFKTNLLIFDCGTALTLNVVDEHGHFKGGYIFPGTMLMQQSLLKQTALGEALPVLSAAIEQHQLPTNTHDAILLGSMEAARSIIVEQVSRLEKKMSMHFTVVVTGGGAKPLLPSLPASYLYLPQLVFEGLTYFVKK